MANRWCGQKHRRGLQKSPGKATQPRERQLVVGFAEGTNTHFSSSCDRAEQNGTEHNRIEDRIEKLAAGMMLGPYWVELLTGVTSFPASWQAFPRSLPKNPVPSQEEALQYVGNHMWLLPS